LAQNRFDYINQHKSKSFQEPEKRITYRYNDMEITILGHVETEGEIIRLYEYRGVHFGSEFLISFSKNSTSYQLLDIQEKQNDPGS
jgi:hypothetical protein